MGALSSFKAWRKVSLAEKRPEPSYPLLPVAGPGGESNRKGLILVGEIAGTPLIKLGLNQGVDAIEKLHKSLPEPDADEDLLDVVIVGAGASGLGAAMRAHELGMRYQVIEANRIANTVELMYKGKPLFAEPEEVSNRSTFWFEECTREELLARWHEQITETGLAINQFEKVEDLKKSGDEWCVMTQRSEYRCKRVLLAMGKAGNPRKANVPGEEEFPEKLFHHLSDPEQYTDRDILIYGGGDVATEAALALKGNNRVTLVTVDEALIYPKLRNREAVMKAHEAGEMSLHLSTSLLGFTREKVQFKKKGGEQQEIPNDLVFEMIGAELPLAFFRRIGIKLEGSWDVRKWLYLLAVFVGVYSLYALKKFPEQPYSWPFHLFIEEEAFKGGCAALFEAAFFPFAWLFSEEAYNQILQTTWYQQGYLYSLIYTIAMLLFGIEALKRWSNVARDNRYQKWRYYSLIGFQVGFFLIVNVVALQGMAIDYSWRAWGLYAPWPLFFNTFHWWNESDPRILIYLFVGAGLLGTFVFIPWASRRHGKRFCTWICGCGGLAETLGDRWRHLSPKGERSRSWEFQSVVVLLAALIVTLVTVGMFNTRADNLWAQSYSYLVDFWLIAVIPVALYPFFGGKVWCRYWCPLAAWNQILARWYGKLKITSNENCITCTLCSRYCQVGVDVMAFAKNQVPFDNRNSSCIHCGICIDVCPMDVLRFDDSDGVSLVALENT